MALRLAIRGKAKLLTAGRQVFHRIDNPIAADGL
jgi:hypothetical protein